MKGNEPVQFSRMKILMVDADRSASNTRAIMLSTYGHDVECVTTVADARSHCRHSHPDLVLVGLGGESATMFRLLNEVRAAKLGRRIVVLMNEQHRLCPVTWDGETVLQHEGAEELLLRIVSSGMAAQDS